MRIESQEEKDARLSRQNGDKRRQTHIKQEESEGKEAVDCIAGREKPGDEHFRAVREGQT
jgi:hypothetical protein